MFTSGSPLYWLLRFKVIFTHAGAVEIIPENLIGKEGQNTAITCCFSVITSPTWLINESRHSVQTALENNGSCYCQTLNLTLKRNYDKTTVQCTINSGTTRSGILMIKLFSKLALNLLNFILCI